MGNFIGGDVNNNGGVVGIGHEELAEVGSYETATADQAYGEGSDLFAIQIQPRHRRKNGEMELQQEKKEKEKKK